MRSRSALLRWAAVLPILSLALVFSAAEPARAQESDPAASSEAPDSPKTDVSIAVAAFERVGRVGNDVPDVAMMLARRLSTLGVERVVSPRDLGVQPTGEPEAQDLMDWAGRAGVQTVVVGRTTALGSRLSIDARLHSGATGEPLGRRFFVEVPKTRDLPVAVQDLAEQVLEQTQLAELPRVAMQRPADEPGGEAGAPAEPERPRAGFRKDAPISIRSDTLEVFDRGGEKRFVFRGSVRATQGDLEITSQKLNALYPPGGSQPHKIVATGQVLMKQAGRVAHCDEATFYRDDDRVVCTGEIAEVEQGCDVVRGREIIFHTRSEKLKVNGAADVRINSDGACGNQGEQG